MNRGWLALCWALIAFVVFRVLQITPDWVMGARPSYPGQYQARLLGALQIVGLMGAVLVNQGPARSTARGRFAYWALLATSMVAVAFNLWVEFTRPAT